MPVLSPHHTSYRSSLDRPSYYNSSSFTPRISSYSERFSTRSFIDSEGRRTFSRSGSITEDGVTSRFKEELRDGSSIRRESVSRDSSYDFRREGSSSREHSSVRLSSIGVLDDLTELRNKYSPNNYVPAIHRKNENPPSMGRSKSINDIGLPPNTPNKKKVIIALSTPSASNNATTPAPPVKTIPNDSFNANNIQSVCATNNKNNNNDNSSNNDGNNNTNRATVADLRKKFDTKTTSSTNNTEPETVVKLVKNNKFKIMDQETNNKGMKQRVSGNVRKVAEKPKGGHVAMIHKENNGDETGKIARKIVEKTRKIKTTAVAVNNNNSSSTSDENGTRDASEIGDAARNKIEIELEPQRGNEREITPNPPLRDLDATSPKLNNNNSSIGGKQQQQSRASPTSTSIVLSNNNNISSTLGRKSVERRGGAAAYDEDIYDRSSSIGYRLGTVSPTTVSTVKTLGLNGLKNIGNTCFMNSVIQCLSNTRLLLEYLLHDEYVKDINQTNSSMKGYLIRAFAEVIKELWAEDASDRVINTSSLKNQIQRFASRFMGYAQQDAQEFLRYLLEGLHEDVNRVKEKPTPIHTEIDDRLDDVSKSSESWNRYLRMDNSRIVDIFVGQLKSTLKCTYCGHCSVTFDPFWDLSLPIPTRTGPLRLSQCLESFTREETLDGDEKPTCSKCKERRKCTKSFSIQKFPKILVIHLKRFSPTERFRGKLSVTVDFPLENLDMSKYAAEGVSSSRYNLYAVSNHSGTTYSGHYTAYCRHPYVMTWHEYNDSRVSTVSQRSVVSSEAYVLFYEQEGHRSHL